MKRRSFLQRLGALALLAAWSPGDLRLVVARAAPRRAQRERLSLRGRAGVSANTQGGTPEDDEALWPLA